MKTQSPNLYKRLYYYIRPYKGRIIIAMVASLLVAGSDVALVRLIQPLIDKVLGSSDRSLIHLVPIFFVSLTVIKGAGRYVQEYFIRTSGQLVIQEIRNDLYSHTIGLSLGFFSRATSGNLMSRILNDVGKIQKASASVLVDALRESTTLVGYVGLAFYFDWRLATVAFIAMPLSFGPAKMIGKKIKSYSKRGQGAMGVLTSVLEQTFSGVKVIKAFGTIEQEKQRFRQQNLGYYHFLRKTIKYNAVSSPVIEILASFGGAGVLWFGVHRVISGQMTSGELISTTASILLMYAPVKRLTKVYNTVQEALGAAERVFDLMDEVPEITDRPDAVELTSVMGRVELKDIHFSYGDGPILKGVSIVAEPGEIVAMVGSSGAGKSTISSLLNRFYEPQQGEILIDGHEIRELTLDTLHRNISLVDQDTFLFNDTIANNISYGVSGATREEVVAAARLAYADDFIHELPQQYDTRIGDRGVRLSGGQRQRICIARALLRNTPILVLDEATSALDTESEAMVQKALNNLMQNRTTFVIAHRLSTVMHADKIVVLDEGQVQQIGRHQELLDRGGIYKKLFEMQFQV